jgi:hypothetical protein
VAWHLSRGKLWIVILVPILTACAATGDAGYLWLQVHKLVPENIIDPHSLLDNPDQPNNWLVRHLKPIYHAARPELMPPGFGGWVGSFHSAQTGQLIICFSLLSLIEVLRRKRTNWPWICLGISPFLMLTTCTWGVPMAGFIVLSGLIACFWMKIVPENSRLVLAVFAGLVALVEPMLSYFLQWSLPATVSLAESDMHTELPEFLAQWWPVFIPWIALCLTWKRLSPTTHIVLIMTPLAFAWVEIWNFGWRGDMTAKSWGIIYASAWIVFLPEIARQRRWPFRVILILIASTCALSLCFWVTYYSRVIVPEEIGHLDGQGQFRLDPRKAKILETLSRLKDRIIVTGRVEERDTQNTLLAQLSCNRAYVAWSMILDTTFYSNGLGEATRRNVEVNALYDGKESNPLEFLRQRDIAALVIYPNDNIDPAIVDQFKQKLAPYYTYEDGYSPTSEQPQQALSPERPCAGVFLYHPEMAALAGAAQGP